MSLNLLFYGFQPQKPLSEYIAKSGDDAINAEFIPQLSRKPIAVCQGEIVYCMLAELKADWKFHKDFLQHVYVYVCMDYTPKDVQTYFFHEPGAIQPAMWLEQCGAMPPLLRAEGQLLKFPLSLAPKSST